MRESPGGRSPSGAGRFLTQGYKDFSPNVVMLCCAGVCSLSATARLPGPLHRGAPKPLAESQWVKRVVHPRSTSTENMGELLLVRSNWVIPFLSLLNEDYYGALRGGFRTIVEDLGGNLSNRDVLEYILVWILRIDRRCMAAWLNKAVDKSCIWMHWQCNMSSLNAVGETVCHNGVHVANLDVQGRGLQE